MQEYNNLNTQTEKRRIEFNKKMKKFDINYKETINKLDATIATSLSSINEVVLELEEEINL